MGFFDFIGNAVKAVGNAFQTAFKFHPNTVAATALGRVFEDAEERRRRQTRERQQALAGRVQPEQALMKSISDTRASWESVPGRAAIETGARVATAPLAGALKIVEGVSIASDFAIQQGTTPIRTLAVVSNQESPLYGDWGKSFEAATSDEFSTWEAVTANKSMVQNIQSGTQINPVGVPELNQVPTEALERAGAFGDVREEDVREAGGPYSGTMGAVTTAALDPLNYIGIGAVTKGAKALTAVRMAGPKARETLMEGLRSARLYEETGGKEGSVNGAGQMGLELLKEKRSSVLQNWGPLQGFNSAQRGAFGTALAKIDTWEDLEPVIGHIVGHGPSTQKLWDKQPALAWELRTAEDESSKLFRLQGFDNNGGELVNMDKIDPEGFPLLTEMFGEPDTWKHDDITRFVASARERWNDWNRVMSLQGVGSNTQNGFVATTRTGEKLKMANARARSRDMLQERDGWSVRTAGRNAGQMALTVFKWANNEKPAGTYNLDGTSAVTVMDELVAQVRSTKALRGQENVDVRRGIIDRFAAVNHSDVQMYEVLGQTEKDLIQAVGKKYGLDAAKTEMLASRYREMQKTAQDDFVAKGGYGFYKKPDGSWEAKHNPEFATQIANKFIMMDINGFDRYLQKDMGGVATRLRTGTGELLGKAVDEFMDYWRPLSVLKVSTAAASTWEEKVRSAALFSALHMSDRSYSWHRVGQVQHAGQTRNSYNTAKAELDSATARIDMAALADNIDSHLSFAPTAREASVKLGLFKSGEVAKPGAVGGEGQNWSRTQAKRERRRRANEQFLASKESGVVSVKRDGSQPYVDDSELAQLEEWSIFDLDDDAIRELTVYRDELRVRSSQQIGDVTDAQLRVNGLQNNYTRSQNSFTARTARGDAVTTAGIFGESASQDGRLSTISAGSIEQGIIQTRTRMVEKNTHRLTEVPNSRVDPDMEEYPSRVAEYVNYHIRSNPLGMAHVNDLGFNDFNSILSDGSYVSNKTLDFINDTFDDVTLANPRLHHYLDSRQVINDLMTPELKNIARQRDLTDQDVIEAFWNKDLSELAPVSGSLFDSIGMHRGSVKRGFQNFMSFNYGWMMQKPSDALNRVPMAKSAYNSWWDNYFSGLDIPIEDVTPEMIRAADANAAKWATSVVKKGFYGPERRTNFAAATQRVMPFAAAMQNSVNFWAKMVLNEPKFLYAASAIWSTPDRIGLSGEDGYINVPLAWLPGIPEGYDVKFSKRGLLADQIIGREQAFSEGLKVGDVELGSAFQFTPGVNPMISIATSEATKAGLWGDLGLDQNEFTKRLGKWILPYGPSETDSSVDLLGPGWMKRIGAWWQGEGSRQYQFNLMRVYGNELHNYSNGVRTTKPTLDEAREMTDGLMLVQAAFAFLIPGGAKMTPPLQAQVDEYRKLVESYGKNQADMTMVDQYGPDILAVLGGTTKSTTGIASTERDWRTVQDNKELVGTLAGIDPETVALLVADRPYQEGGYDQDARMMLEATDVPGLKGEKFQERLTPEEQVKRAEVAKGWVEFNRTSTILDAIEAAAVANGYDKADAKKQKQELKNEFYSEAQQANPTWWSAFRGNGQKVQKAVAALEQIVSDREFMEQRADDPYWQSVAAFVDLREAAVRQMGTSDTRYAQTPAKARKALLARAKKENWRQSTIDRNLAKLEDEFATDPDKKAGVVLSEYNDSVERLKAGNTHFANMYDKWFSSESYFGLKG